MRVKVDQEMCIGSGNCEATCPKVFKVVDGKSQVQADPVPEAEEDRAGEAISGCPVGAISTV
jgi:ferredoxin